jgi:enterochelin esterase-like enzyme
VAHEYGISLSPKRTVVVGSSLGGLAASYIAFRHADVFGNVLSQSGSYWWKPNEDVSGEWLTVQFVSSPLLAIKFDLEVCLFENESIQEGESNLVANRHFRDVLQAKGYEIQYVEFSGGHEFINWQPTLASGLVDLLGQNH